MNTLSTSEIDHAAQALFEAEKHRVQIDPVSMNHPEMTLEDAYAIQQQFVQLKLDAGDQKTGYKIGLTSRVMQRAMKIDSPDYGTLLRSMHFDDGDEIETARFTDPKIEVELAFVLKDELSGSDLQVTDVLNATDYVVPALELISARSYRIHPDTCYVRKIHDTISDNAANAGIILGGTPARPDDLDLRWVGGILYKNGVIEETGLAAAVLNHPANGIRWIARRFAPHGVSLKPGEILLSGSFTAPVEVQQGDVIQADYGALGNVCCRFV